MKLTSCAPQLRTQPPNGAHGVLHPANPRGSWLSCKESCQGILLTPATFETGLKIGFNQAEPRMEDKGMHFLDASRHLTGNDDFMIRLTLKLATRLA